LSAGNWMDLTMPRPVASKPNENPAAPRPGGPLARIVVRHAQGRKTAQDNLFLATRITTRHVSVHGWMALFWLCRLFGGNPAMFCGSFDGMLS
jgi:hypothetical protein